MKVKVLPRLGQSPIEIPAAVVVIEDDYGRPISVACVVDQDGTHIVSTINEGEKFLSTLRMLGIDKTTICDKVSAPKTGTPLLLP